MDLDYTDYIDSNYLPIGFDATADNPYEKKMMGEDYADMIFISNPECILNNERF